MASSLSWTSERLPAKGPAKGPAQGQAQGPAQLPTMSHMTAAHAFRAWWCLWPVWTDPPGTRPWQRSSLCEPTMHAPLDIQFL